MTFIVRGLVFLSSEWRHLGHLYVTWHIFSSHEIHANLTWLVITWMIVYFCDFFYLHLYLFTLFHQFPSILFQPFIFKPRFVLNQQGKMKNPFQSRGRNMRSYKSSTKPSISGIDNSNFEGATAISKRFQEVGVTDELDEKLGFPRYEAGPKKIGWLVNMHSVCLLLLIHVPC